jgi:hypothetical protein
MASAHNNRMGPSDILITLLAIIATVAAIGATAVVVTSVGIMASEQQCKTL